MLTTLEPSSLRLDFKLAEDLSSVCRICRNRVTDKPLVQVDLYLIDRNRKAPQHQSTAFYCFKCYSFVYSQRKQLPFKVPSFLGLVYDVPTSIEAGLVLDHKLFNILEHCCPADALQRYKTSLE